MLGDGVVRGRHIRVAAKWVAGSFVLAMAAGMTASTAAARTSCPLSTTVPPFAASVGDRYEIVTTDGGEGDLDGAADGSCHVVVNVCRADASLCDGATLEHTAVRVIGRRLAREPLALLEARLNDELAALPTSSAPCRPLRIELSADDDIALRFRSDAESERGRSVLRRSRLGLVCRAAGDAVPSHARCNGRRGCPPRGTAACGNDLRDVQTERCDGGDDVTCPGTCRTDCSCGIEEDDFDLAPDAVVTASSSASDSAPGFAVDRVVDGWPGKPEHEWTSSGEGQGAWLKLEWPRPVRVDGVVLYDRPNVTDNVTSGALFVDDDPSRSRSARSRRTARRHASRWAIGACARSRSS
jgi:hypothetical protein